MTLPASGTISASQINVELGRASNAAFDINGAAERELAEVPSGAISFSDFHGKSAFSVVRQGQAENSGGSPVSITSVPCGADANPRRMFMMVHWRGTATANRTISSATIGGVAATVHAQHGQHNSGTNDQYGVAIISAIVNTGSSVTVVITMSGTWNGSIRVDSVRTTGLIGSAIDGDAADCGSLNCNDVNISVSVPALGVIFVAVTGDRVVGTPATTVTDPAPGDYAGTYYAGRVLTGQPLNAARNLSGHVNGGGADSPNVSIAGVTWTGK